MSLLIKMADTPWPSALVSQTVKWSPLSANSKYPRPLGRVTYLYESALAGDAERVIAMAATAPAAAIRPTLDLAADLSALLLEKKTQPLLVANR